MRKTGAKFPSRKYLFPALRQLFAVKVKKMLAYPGEYEPGEPQAKPRDRTMSREQIRRRRQMKLGLI